MKTTRRQWLRGALGSLAACPILRIAGSAATTAPEAGSKETRSQEGASRMDDGSIRYVRFEQRGRSSWGILEGRVIREIIGRPWESDAQSGFVVSRDEVKLLFPAEPTKILALAGNYKSHLAGTTPPANPEVFYKPPTCLLAPEGTIVLPHGTSDVHYEGELVVVIGKKARGVSAEEAASCVFGLACGNDVSARDWQKNDKQWWRAKGCDTFGPLGPWIARGLDGGDLLLTTRLNGEVKQQARTSELIFDIPQVVSFVSHHLTLLPGDLIFTGTPGTTSAMKVGDVVEVEIEKIGILKNRVV